MIGEVDTGIPVKGSFRFVHQFLGVVLAAVPASPAAQLFRVTAAEADQLVPVLLKEVEDSGDDLFLLLNSIPEGVPVDMDMEPASGGLVATITQRDRFPGQFLPREFTTMELSVIGWVTSSNPSFKEPSCLMYIRFPVMVRAVLPIRYLPRPVDPPAQRRNNGNLPRRRPAWGL